MRRFGLMVVLFVAIAAGCGGGSASGSTGSGATAASATVTVGGTVLKLSGGRCEQIGVLGWKVTAGDYDYDLAEGGEGDYLELFVSEQKITGGVQGRAGGVPWALSGDPAPVGSISSGMTGTFSGSDSVSGLAVRGTFACR